MLNIGTLITNSMQRRCLEHATTIGRLDSLNTECNPFASGYNMTASYFLALQWLWGLCNAKLISEYD